MINEDQARRLVESAQKQTEIMLQILSKLEECNDTITTLAGSLDPRLENIQTTLDDIENGVGTIIGKIPDEGGDS